MEPEAAAFLEAIARIETDPDNEPLPVESLVDSLSMWKAHEDRCRIFPSQYRTKIVPETSIFANLMRQQKLAICAAIGFMRYPAARNWEVSQGSDAYDEDDGSGIDEVPKWARFPEAERSIRPPGFVPSSQCQVQPPGAGKTAVIIHLAALAARNCLIITNSRENAIQVVKAIHEHTNIASSFPVKVIRSNEEILKDDFVMRKAPTAEEMHVLKYGGLYGISVIDVNTFHDFTGASGDRNALRMRIFGSIWDLVIIDEADSVSALQMRQAFRHGAVGEALQSDADSVKKSATMPSGAAAASSSSSASDGLLRYRLNYKKLVAMSGTWHRGDAAGYRFLKSLGPITYSIKSRELEEMGVLAKMEVVLVRCTDEQQWVRTYAGGHNFEALTPEKLRVCERLVRFHVAHGQKIMIFTKNHWHLRYLERLFPFALAPTGETAPKEFARMLELFKRPVSTDSPLVWITTTKGEVGMDVPDTCVVINLVNYGESSRCLRQRMGRASRKMFRFGWFYDLVGEHETPWASRLTGENMMSSAELFQNAPRYKLLYEDGYEDVLKRMTSHEVVERVDSHVRWMNDDPGFDEDVKDEMETTAEACKALNDNLVFGEEHGGLALVDHVISCILGSGYEKEQLKCDETLFDTQTQIRLRAHAAASKDRQSAKKVAERRKKLPFAMKPAPKRPRPAPSDPVAKESIGFEPRLLSADEYQKFQMPSRLRNDPSLRATLVAAFQSSASQSEFGSTVVSNDSTALWTAIMKLRSLVNLVQFENDRNRGSLCEEVLMIGDGAQENCTFLHDA
jgi:superfamily II DNA or RNA helicase